MVLLSHLLVSQFCLIQPARCGSVQVLPDQRVYPVHGERLLRQQDPASRLHADFFQYLQISPESPPPAPQNREFLTVLFLIINDLPYHPNPNLLYQLRILADLPRQPPFIERVHERIGIEFFHIIIRPVSAMSRSLPSLPRSSPVLRSV